MKLNNHRILCTEVFKTMIDLNPTCMKEIFERSVSNKRPVRQNYKINLVIPKANLVRYETKLEKTCIKNLELTTCKHQIF